MRDQRLPLSIALFLRESQLLQSHREISRRLRYLTEQPQYPPPDLHALFQVRHRVVV